MTETNEDLTQYNYSLSKNQNLSYFELIDKHKILIPQDAQKTKIYEMQCYLPSPTQILNKTFTECGYQYSLKT